MAPLKISVAKKSSQTTNSENLAPSKTVITRSLRLPQATLKKENTTVKDAGPIPKRKAVSPIKGNTLKRSALGNITNASIESQGNKANGKSVIKKPLTSTVTKPTIATAAKITQSVTTNAKCGAENISKASRSPSQSLKSMLPPLPKSRLTQPTKSVVAVVLPSTSHASVPVKPAATEKSATSRPAALKKPGLVPVSKCKVTVKPKCVATVAPTTRRSSGRRSTLDSSAGSLYVSCLSDVLDEDSTASSSIEEPEPLPQPDVNIDEEYVNDPFQCATYAHDIFEYLKTREQFFKIKDYMDMQTSLSQHARSILVDWMVEIQENFEMNHETLYLGVKLVDMYLSKIKVSKQSLQLVGATAMFIAAKYDERIPPAIEDFLYICDGAYKRNDITKMEVNILRVVKFELGFPLSYRFLRRYARCAKVPMPLLTLARYILEYTLMDYATISLSDSKMACAALYLAFKMKKEQEWDNTLIHFSGYRVKDFVDISRTLNNSLHQKPRQSLSTVRNKYSHKIFYEVASIPLIKNEDL